jgi:small-conductance mechanosensitive channel
MAPVLSWLLIAILTLALPGTQAVAEPSNSAQIALTQQELDWLSTHPLIRLAPDPDFAPIEFIDQAGHYQGIAFANFVSGLIVLFERPIRIGDTVTVGTTTGTVTRIRTRATTITDRDRKELIIPNKSFVTGDVINWTLSDPVTRLIIRVGVAYGSDVELIERLMLDLAKAHPLVLDEPPPTVFFSEFGDSALNFELRVFYQDILNKILLTHELNKAIDKCFSEHGIVIPFPQRDIHIRSNDPI